MLLEGKPLQKGTVNFSPDPADPERLSGYGLIDENGNFEAQSAAVKGLPKGRYKATVFFGKVGREMPSAPFDPKYSSIENTPLTVEVTENPAPGAYEIHLTKK